MSCSDYLTLLDRELLDGELLVGQEELGQPLEGTELEAYEELLSLKDTRSSDSHSRACY